MRRPALARALLALSAIVGLGSWLGPACAAGNDAAGGGGNGGHVGLGGSTSDGGSGGSGGTAGGLVMHSGGGGAGGFGGGCVGVSSKANPIPLDIFVMLDQSGSMNTDAGNSLSRWKTVQSAFTAFVQEPEAKGIGVGIQYFPLPDPTPHGCAQQTCTIDGDCMDGCTLCMPQGLCEGPYNPDTDSCEPIDYTWADVAIEPLPGVGAKIITSIASHSPAGNTPTFPSLQGAIDYASKWAVANPTHVTVVAYATDGEPSECDQDADHVNALAAAGFAAVPSIQTFVIGVGPALTKLDDIAKAGGTTKAFHVDVNAMATDKFLAALNTIRGVALACNYQIPDPPQGMTIDYGQVNVEFEPGKNKKGEVFPKVADKAHCPANGDGWYYDDDAMPTRIILCKSSCDRVSNLIEGELDVVLGCATIVP